MVLYSIANWKSNFESRDSKRTDGPLKWIPVPTKTDGFGFSRLRMQENAADLLAAWYLMLGIAARQNRENRGNLSRDGIPLDDKDLALITGFPVKIFTDALLFLSEPKQGWLVTTESEHVAVKKPQVAVFIPQVAANLAHSREDNNREDNNISGVCAIDQSGPAAHPPSPVDELTLTDEPKAKKSKLTDSEWLEEIKADPTYFHVDIAFEHGKMVRWCEQKKVQPTRLRFLNWIGRIEKPMQGSSGAIMR